MSELDLRQDGSVTQFEAITTQRRELLKRTICRDLTNDELDLFVAVCNRRRLDPFARQIHAVKRRQWNAKLDEGRGGYEEVMVIQTGIDGYRLIADRTQERDGIDGPWWCDTDGVWRDVWLSANPPAAAKVIAYRKGHTRAYPGIAHWTEYVQTYRDKKGNVQPVQMWRDMPAGQLAKCAEALAWRKAFPEELAGIYTDEEMGQAEESPGPMQVTRPPAGPGAAKLRADSATPGVPTTDQIRRLRKVEDAHILAEGASDDFKHALLNQFNHEDEWRAFWRDASLASWKDHLRDARTHLDDQTSAAGDPPPAADHQSDPTRAGHTAESSGEGRAEPATTVGSDPEVPGAVAAGGTGDPTLMDGGA